MNQIEKMVAKLQHLAGKTNLSAAENAEAKELMRNLKSEGSSNKEISKLSGGRWSESTVKGYTAGIASPSPSPWTDALSALTELISAQISLDYIKSVLAANHTLAGHGLTLEEVTGFLETVAGAKMDPAHLVKEIKSLEQAGLSLKAAAEATALKEKMEGSGLTLETLPSLAKLAGKYASPGEILEVVSSFNSLDEIRGEICADEELRDEVRAQAEAAAKKLEQDQTETKKLQKPLEAYAMVQKLGFTDKVLGDLSGICQNLGGPKEVMAAVKKYKDLEQINGRIAKAQSELDKLETKISRKNAEWDYLKSSIQMCNTLMRDYQFGLDAIGTILNVAGKYGKPVSVLKAIESFGQIGALAKDYKALEGAVEERQKLLDQLEGQFNEAQEALDRLQAQALRTGQEIGEMMADYLAQQRFIKKILDFANEPEKVTFAEHGQAILLAASSLRQWVEANEARFQAASVIKIGLETLTYDLGGQ